MNSDYQACSSDNFAIIEDPRSRSECDTDHSDTDGEDITLSPPKPKVSKKLLGAATYKTKFNPVWTKEYPFITSVSGDPYRY